MKDRYNHLLSKITERKSNVNPEIVAMGLSLRSLYLVSQYIPLSDVGGAAAAALG